MMKPKNTICPWFNNDGRRRRASRRYVSDSKVAAVHEAPSDYPGGKKGTLTVDFSVVGIPCLGLNGGPTFANSEAFSFQCDGHQKKRTATGTPSSAMAAIKRVRLVQGPLGLRGRSPARSRRACCRRRRSQACFDARMKMGKIDVATIEAARRG